MPKKSSKSIQPEVHFALGIQTCSKAWNSAGYSPKIWKPGQFIGFVVYKNGKDAGMEDNDAAQYREVNFKLKKGLLIGTITMTLDQFYFATLAHECLHAVTHWASKHRPKKATPLCKEEMNCYALQYLIEGAIVGFKKRGYKLAS
jgi:hypothetical protein